MKSTAATLFGVAIAIALAGDAASAQERPERPYRGLFGGGGGSGDMEQSLTATASVGGGFDTDVLTDASEAGFGRGPGGPINSREGGYILFSEAVNYSLDKRTVSFGANGSASARYYPTLENSFINNYGAGLGTSWKPTTRNRVSANASFTYQPFSLHALFPVFGQTPLGEVYLADLDYGTVDAGYYTSSASVSASRNLSSRATISGDYSYQRSDFALYPDYTSDTIGARFSRNLKAGLALRIGYNYTSSRYGGDTPIAGRHGLDTGVDYSKTLSFSRRTSLAFSTGGAATKYEGDTHFTAIGSANLRHEIGRTWTFNAAYNRNIGFLETFSAAPFVYDAATVTLEGLLDRRWSFHAASGAALGNLGFGSSRNGFNTYYATTGLSRALNRHVSLGIDYSVYRYDFDQTTLLPQGYNSDFSRNTVRATLNAWLPLFQRGRRGNAAR